MVTLLCGMRTAIGICHVKAKGHSVGLTCHVIRRAFYNWHWYDGNAYHLDYVRGTNVWAPIFESQWPRHRQLLHATSTVVVSGQSDDALAT